MSKPKTIKQIFADALYWAMSPKSKGKPYHITRTEESVVRKLIHYDNKNPKITFSNRLIGDHTYLEESTVEKVIPSINKKGYITTITFQVNDGTGKITSRRIININWDFISSVLNDVPKTPSTEEEPLSDNAMLEVTLAESIGLNDTSESSMKEEGVAAQSQKQSKKKSMKSTDSNEKLLKLQFDTDIETDDSEGDTLMYKSKQEVIAFIPAEIEYAHGLIENDEVVLVNSQEKLYFRKSHLNHLYQGCFE